MSIHSTGCSMKMRQKIGAKSKRQPVSKGDSPNHF
jgi:hypothetical protein